MTDTLPMMGLGVLKDYKSTIILLITICNKIIICQTSSGEMCLWHDLIPKMRGTFIIMVLQFISKFF